MVEGRNLEKSEQTQSNERTVYNRSMEVRLWRYISLD